MSRPRVLFYCQHSVGLGHLVRSYALAGALAERFHTVLVCGGALPDAIPSPAGVDIVALPPLGVAENGVFVSHDARLSVEAARARRRAMLLETARALRPDAVLVELFPFGRAKFAAEIVPLLEDVRGDAVVACSLRDILVTRRARQAEHDRRACEVANRHFDAVLVHADPRFARLEESFALRRALRVPVHYTGFVLPNGARPRREAAPERRIVVSAGGGLVGAPLLNAAVAAHRIVHSFEPVTTTVIGGPFLPERAWAELGAAARGAEGLELRRSVPDLGTELANASASVSQCGYNTALELLHARVPALVVPYATPEEDEQRRRAARLERLGAVRVLDPERLGAEALAAEQLALRRFEPAAPALDFDGARCTARLLARLVTESPVPQATAAASPA